MFELSSLDRLKGVSRRKLFKNLMRDPFGENPEMLVEGMWSINFTTDHTVSEEMELEGEGETVYPFINTTATLKKIKLTPLGFAILNTIREIVLMERQKQQAVSASEAQGRFLVNMSHEIVLCSYSGEKVKHLTQTHL